MSTTQVLVARVQFYNMLSSMFFYVTICYVGIGHELSFYVIHVLFWTKCLLYIHLSHFLGGRLWHEED